MFATNFAVMGALLLSFLSCLAYGKRGITAVILFALAILHACIIMQSSMRAVLICPHPVLMI
jgi:sugar phosphate permease